MTKLSEFINKSRTKNVYWANTFDNTEAVFRLDQNGNTYTKLKGGTEFSSEGSNIADESLMALKEITKKEYEDF